PVPFARSVSLPSLHTFPTRRSSDLSDLEHEVAQAGIGGVGEVAPSHGVDGLAVIAQGHDVHGVPDASQDHRGAIGPRGEDACLEDRKSTRLNSSHVSISYAVFCLNT